VLIAVAAMSSSAAGRTCHAKAVSLQGCRVAAQAAPARPLSAAGYGSYDHEQAANWAPPFSWFPLESLPFK